MSESISDLEKDIEQRRARLDETIDRIQGRLNASSLVDEMLGSARRTPYSGFYDEALDTVRRNPVPVLLIAAGVGLLLNGLRSGRQRGSRALVPVETVPVETKPVTVTGADRTYDPDAPAGKPPHDLPGERPQV
ncbi:DUF3618 domain-containing protein [Methylorubrum salsuginis]|uniref:Membrane-anchored ribosome-binding protein, inhibits growth in stationary phase, ElaB/YqjD/DUF883 family n=1 Tax=Methylorubrum salsuginis TaxID=414703 RepID=A0A1I4C4S6_9HYPH|nr:DUF3618 domain-containing protein [Methylorubrum salsuginis]SFK75121.1 Protein of unknown function [Methylorubrum salsuginis]